MRGINPRTAPFFFLLLSTALSALLGSSVVLAVEDFVGEMSSKQLLEDYPVFLAEYDRYEPTPMELQQFSALAGKEVTALFGTWCHDSEREVPRFLKLLTRSDIELKSLRLIAVDRDKKEEQGIAQALDLKYTPTFVVQEAGNEVARIIETPQGNLAADFSRQLLP